MTPLTTIAASFLLFAGTANAATYTVQSGDSLWKIASKYNITTADLMTSNQLTTDMILPGQSLKVPGPTPYTVQNSDTMWLISQKFGLTLDTLLKANPQLTNPSNIWSGLTINIPDGSAPSVNSTASTPAPAAPAAVRKPTQLTNGQFPLGKGTYQGPLEDNYADGRSWTPTGGAERTHEGVDIMAAKGTPIYSVLDGTIINFGWNEYGGWRVTVRVDDSTVFYYAHLSKYADGIGMGSKVKKGQLLGYVGNTGYGPEGTEGQFDPHLHFGIYKTDAAAWYTIDPFSYLQWWEANNSK
ncbi:LysM peptidoglycan-binding domain-containing protein [Paenibacillus cremeus]|nr:M23 family metallopeptidase [Paenibacillus cremeus]